MSSICVSCESEISKKNSIYYIVIMLNPYCSTFHNICLFLLRF